MNDVMLDGSALWHGVPDGTGPAAGGLSTTLRTASGTRSATLHPERAAALCSAPSSCQTKGRSAAFGALPAKPFDTLQEPLQARYFRATINIVPRME